MELGGGRVAPFQLPFALERDSEISLQRSSRRDDPRLIVVGFRVGTGTALELSERWISHMVVHTTIAVTVEYVERVESEEKSNAVAD